MFKELKRSEQNDIKECRYLYRIIINNFARKLSDFKKIKNLTFEKKNYP